VEDTGVSLLISSKTGANIRDCADCHFVIDFVIHHGGWWWVPQSSDMLPWNLLERIIYLPSKCVYKKKCMT